MVSTTTTGVSASTTCGTSAQYELPVKDAACGVPNSSKNKPIIEACAKPAGVLAYDNDCALYALAVDQSVQSLTDCLYKEGIDWKDVWCYGSTNGTATATSYPTATATANDTSTETSKATGTRTATSSTSTSTANGAPCHVSGISLKSVLAVSSFFVSAVLSGV
jgi:hypothetical protein